MSIEPPIRPFPPRKVLLERLVVARSADREQAVRTLREECAQIRREPEMLRAELHVCAHRFRQGGGAKWCGYSSVRDFAVERLGVAPATFYRWAKAGELPPMDVSPPHGPEGSSLGQVGNHLCMDSLASGDDEALVKLIATDTDAANQSVPAEPDPAAILVSMRMDSSFAPYLRDTLRLAGALIGSEVDDETKLAAILAEASSEVEPATSLTPGDDELASPLPAVMALRHAGIQARQGRPRVPKPTTNAANPRSAISLDSIPGNLDADGALDADGTHVLRQGGALGQSGPLDRNSAHALDFRLRRLIAQRRRMMVRHEAKLLQFHGESVHSLLGYRRFDEFARIELGLSPSKTFEMLDRARRYRQEHPIAIARATGRIGAIQASLLNQIWRMGLPRSDLPRWIDLAGRLTVRGLRDRIAWAREQADSDYRAWSLRGCPPPTEVELRTARHSLLELAANPVPTSLLERRTLPWKRKVRFQWVLDEDTAGFLAQLIASVQKQSIQEGHGICESWRALIILCYHARRAWSQLEHAGSRKDEAVLDRDDWRCAVPGCSSRRSLHRHHIVFSSHGGSDASENLITVCAFHHLIGVHQGILAIRGKAAHGCEDLRFDLGLRPGQQPLVSFRGEHRLRRGGLHPATGFPPTRVHEPAPRYGARSRANSQPLPHRRRWAMLAANPSSQSSSACHSGTTSG